MTDETNKPLPVSDPHRVAPMFVNECVGAGFLNGVVNLTLATAFFTPTGGAIDPDLVITSRLRTDLRGAQQIVAQLQDILIKNLKPPGESEH